MTETSANLYPALQPPTTPTAPTPTTYTPQPPPSQPAQDLSRLLPTDHEKAFLEQLTAQAPRTVSGARDDPEEALADLISELARLGLVKDSTTET